MDINKPNLYAEFGAKPGFDILISSFSDKKLSFINYLYTDFEFKYKNAGKYIDTILSDKENEEKQQKQEDKKLDISNNSDDLVFKWSFILGSEEQDDVIVTQLKENPETNIKKDNKNKEKSTLSEKIYNYLNTEPNIEKGNKNKEKSTLSEKIYNFINKNLEKIICIMVGFFICYTIFLILLTIKNFMVI
jgi:hypothetical protein